MKIFVDGHWIEIDSRNSFSKDDLPKSVSQESDCFPPVSLGFEAHELLLSEGPRMCPISEHVTGGLEMLLTGLETEVM